MTWAVANRSKIVFEEHKMGALTVMYVPSFDQVRIFNDIPAITPRAVQERYGETTAPVLWRHAEGVVSVYGILRDELRDRRQGVEILLPQDFCPQDTDSFYFIFNKKTVVHGVCKRNDDGREEWRLSLLDIKAKQNLVEMIEVSVTERFLQKSDEQICIAVLNDSELQASLTGRLKPYSINVIDINALSRRKNVKPLYIHRDFSLLLLILPLVALGLLILMITLWVLAQVRLGTMQEDMVRLEEQIRRIQMNSPLAMIDNPMAIQQRLEKPLGVLPSGLVHAAAELGAQFGEVDTVELKNFTTTDEFSIPDTVVALVKLKSFDNAMLLDQEKLAQLLLKDRPWIRSIERPLNQSQLQIEIALKEEGGV